MTRQKAQQVVKSNENDLKLTTRSTYNHKWANESERFEDLQLLIHKPTSSFLSLSTITSRTKNRVKRKMKSSWESQKNY